MKKLTALLLVLVLLIPTTATVFAAGEISAEAKASVTLGMLKGTTGTVDAAYTESVPTRLQVAIIFLRLKELEAEALAFSGTTNFKDRDEVNWSGGRVVMAYLKAHPELGWIGSNGYFNPNSPMSAQAYYKVLLESLGYTQGANGTVGDFTWDNTLQFAATKGMKKAASATLFRVNDMAVATLEALKANLKGNAKTLAEDLVEKGKIEKSAAVAAGVITAPVIFAVEKVEALNLTEVKVAFTDKVDKLSAENIKNYSIDKHEINNALIQPDGKSVILRLDIDQTPVGATPFEQGEEFILEVNGVNNTEKTQNVKNYETKTLNAIDSANPAVEKIELTGPYKIKITFSEPIKDTSNAKVEINNGLYDTTVDTADGTRDIYVEINDTLKEGNYSLTITGVKDYAGFAVLKKTLTLSYKKVTASPTVRVVSSAEKEVVLQFNSPVMDESGDSLNGSYFYHSNSSIHPDVTTKDNQTYILDFSNDPLPEGKVKLVVVYNVGGSAITDEWGNEMKASTTFTLSITADKIKPVVTDFKVKDEQTLALYFSEALNIDTAVDRNNYLIKDDNEDSIDVANADYSINADDAEYMVTLEFDEKLDGSYSIEITGIEDMAAEANVIATKLFTFEVKDETGIDLKAIQATTVEGSGSQPDYIYVTFPEEMMTEGQYGILNTENYLLSSNVGETFDPLTDEDTISLMTGKKTVKITLVDNDIFSVDDDDFRISIARVADKAGNKSTLFAATINPVPDTPVEAINFVAVDTKTVEVTFDGIIKSAPTNGFRISKNGGTRTTPAAVSLRYEDTDDDGSDETIASLTLKSSQQFADSDAQGILEVSIIENTVKSETLLYSDENLDNEVSDGIPPNIIEIDQSGAGRITIRFDEEIEVTNAGLASTDFVIRDKNSKTLVAGVDYNVSVNSSSLSIILTGDYEDYIGRITVDTKDKVTYIYDEDGENVKVKAYGTPKVLTLD
ncbi:MAG: hypothetical protein A2Y23_00180 [Clostridiales bacterium GWB2_37_7]|nr:MAG: hypothetical protein A2Y23_00180 [Clostridiales bacterium GWB2_37_7]